MALVTYESLSVYQKAFALAVELHKMSEIWPKHELYGGMADQIRRSSKGICANLAEGLSKHMSVADKKRFIQTALGSAEEVRVWLSFAVAVGYLRDEEAISYRDAYGEVAAMLYGLMKKAG